MKALVTLVTDAGTKTIHAESDALLSEVLSLADERLDMPCAGKGLCKGCSVYVNGERRLACQTRIGNGVRVELIRPTGLKNITSGKAATAADNPMYSRYGVSVDVGTTTVCASLFDAKGLLGTVTRKNPQTSFGADVISRIERALSGGLDELADCIRESLAEMTVELCSGCGVAPSSIDAAVITGNTVMLYLLTEQNPVALSRAPFEADRLFGEYVGAKTLGLPVSPDAAVYLPRCISSFVGGDITTAVIASGIYRRRETSVLADIGTNGEIALWHGGMLTCCSTAAGPAFEGAGISSGVYGITGAIDRVWHDNGRIRCSTIGGAAALGICGSGIVDALAVMLELQIIDETGAFMRTDECIELENGICITAQDVRRIQLAKGSVRAGLETLLAAADIGKPEVSALYIAGGFGSFADIENAAIIGLIPRELQSRARVAGNAAHTGASMLLLDKTMIGLSEKLAERARTIALETNPVFTDNYMKYMMFE